jgi:hypothetical protein
MLQLKESTEMQLKPEEKALAGAWKNQDGKIIKDKICERIEWLVSRHLKRIKAHSSGWDILFEDPTDQRFWELSYPFSHLHGGGPPTLINLEDNDARNKYGREI